MAKDSAINYQNIPLDNLEEPINIAFSTPSPLNSLITKRKTNIATNDPHIKKIWSGCSGLFETPNFDGSYSGNKKM